MSRLKYPEEITFLERTGQVHGLWVRISARQLGIPDFSHEEQGGAESADDCPGINYVSINSSIML